LLSAAVEHRDAVFVRDIDIRSIDASVRMDAPKKEALISAYIAVAETSVTADFRVATRLRFL
jgi:hypothetical protein